MTRAARWPAKSHAPSSTPCPPPPATPAASFSRPGRATRAKRPRCRNAPRSLRGWPRRCPGEAGLALADLRPALDMLCELREQVPLHAPGGALPASMSGHMAHGEIAHSP